MYDYDREKGDYSMKVLVTGGFGWTAKSIIEELHRNQFEIVVFDISNNIPEYLHEITSEIIIGTVANRDDVKRAMYGCNYVIHLAVAVGKDDYKKADVPFDINVKGTYNILEIAREYKIKKTIIMSEAPVHVHFDEDELFSYIDWKSSEGEDHLYDLTKRLQECIAKDYSDTYGMNITVLRPGHIVDGKKYIDPEGRSLAELTYCRGGWVCRYDVAKVCEKALRIIDSKFNVFHVVGSYQAKKQFNIDRTEKLLNMRIECTFEDIKNDI
jgi:nucleoside-diphosphate-sugar epimerase